MPEMIGGVIDDLPPAPRGTAEAMRQDRSARLERIQAIAAERKVMDRPAKPVKTPTFRGQPVRGAPVDRLAMQMEGPRPITPKPEPKETPSMASENGLGEFAAIRARINGDAPRSLASHPIIDRAERPTVAEAPEAEVVIRRKPGRPPKARPEEVRTADLDLQKKPGRKPKPKPEPRVNHILQPQDVARPEPNVDLFERLHDELRVASSVVYHLKASPSSPPATSSASSWIASAATPTRPTERQT